MKSWIAATLLLISSTAQSANTTHWGYEGPEGPENWAKLSPEFAACDGKNQSPVNLSGFVKAELKPIKFNYHAGGNEIINNGHTIQVNYTPGSTIVLDGHEFTLKQFHFHAPSENQINGKSYPLEAHLVHADKDGNLAVIAVMFKEGKANSTLEKVWSHIPEQADTKEPLTTVVAANGLLPKSTSYYRFEGSLTTPPCSEGVRWIVMKHPMFLSHKELEKFTHVLHHSNNRPIQPLNARVVLKK